MSAAIKVAAVDLDGTLLARDKSISGRDREALRAAKEAGVVILIATSRNRQSAFSIAADLGLEDPVICLNGALVCSRPYGEVIAKKTIPTVAQKRLMAFADQMDLPLSAAAETLTYKKKKEPFRSTPGSVFIETFEDFPPAEQALRFLVTQARAFPYFERLYRQELSGAVAMETYCRSNGSLASIGFYHKQTAKDAAIEKAMEYLGIMSYRLYAIGDNHNDLSMLKKADVSAAPANAVKEALAVVHHQVVDNNQSAVAEFIEQRVLEGA